MLRLPKKVEYGLIALKYISSKDIQSCVSVKEIAETEKIPYDLLAKIMQKLARNEILNSQKGSLGGYSLADVPGNIPLAKIIRAIDYSPQISDCMEVEKPLEACARHDSCPIYLPLSKLQKKINRLFDETTLKDLL